MCVGGGGHNNIFVKFEVAGTNLDIFFLYLKQCCYFRIVLTFNVFERVNYFESIFNYLIINF